MEPGPFARVEKLLEKEFSTMASGAKEDGINNFVRPDDPAAQAMVVPEVIDPLLAHAKAFLATLGVEPQAVEVNLLATAGMRYAERLHGREAVDRLYGTIRDGIAAHGFTVGETRTTCGNEEEGVWTWINLNDIVQHTFDTTNKPLGIIEIGGSSMQISFPTDEPPDAARHIHPVSLNGRTFAVYCQSFIGLGQDDARKEMRRRLGPQGSAVCFPTGFSAALDHGDVVDGIGEYRLAADGTFDFDACSNTYDAIVRTKLKETGTPDLAHSLGDFVGIDAVFHATRHWGIEENPEQLRGAIERTATMSETFRGSRRGNTSSPRRPMPPICRRCSSDATACFEPRCTGCCGPCPPGTKREPCSRGPAGTCSAGTAGRRRDEHGDRDRKCRHEGCRWRRVGYHVVSDIPEITRSSCRLRNASLLRTADRPLRVAGLSK